MTLDWAPLKGYAFPPFSLTSAVLRKVFQDKVDVVLVAPVWQTQPGWPSLLALLTEIPVMIPNSKHVLRDPALPQPVDPMYSRLHLDVYHISGKITKWKAFQRTLPKYSCQLLTNPHT